jgi:hypothetical protein
MTPFCPPSTHWVKTQSLQRSGTARQGSKKRIPRVQENYPPSLAYASLKEKIPLPFRMTYARINRRRCMSDKLKRELEELQTELRNIDSEDPKLQNLADQIQHALTEDLKDLPLVEPLREVAETFEVKHPQLTALINNVMTSLSNIGI